MIWLTRLEVELRRRGVPGGSRRRILSELRDHLGCDPDSEDRLGEPDELAADFAEELATDTARHGAVLAFAALGLTAVILVATQLVLGAADPGPRWGVSLVIAAPAILALVFAPQVALVAGCLALLRVVRRRGPNVLPAAEVALVRRRTMVALVAGALTAAGIVAYALDVSARVPAWWFAFAVAAGLVSLLALAAAAVPLVRTRATVALTAGPAGDVFDDLPPLGALRRHAHPAAALAVLATGTITTAWVAHVERSLAEGLQRGTAEALAMAVCYLALARTLGLVDSRG